MTDHEHAADWILNQSPRGVDMPITCTYTYSFGKKIWDRYDLPEGWAIAIWPRDDRRVKHFPTCGTDGPPLALAFLLDHSGEAVATWDEGRWWTPEESQAWLTMLAVPATYAMAEGMRQQAMPRWWRRRRKPRGQR